MSIRASGRPTQPQVVLLDHSRLQLWRRDTSDGRRIAAHRAAQLRALLQASLRLPGWERTVASPHTGQPRSEFDTKSRSNHILVKSELPRVSVQYAVGRRVEPMAAHRGDELSRIDSGGGCELLAQLMQCPCGIDDHGQMCGRISYFNLWSQQLSSDCRQRQAQLSILMFHCSPQCEFSFLQLVIVHLPSSTASTCSNNGSHGCARILPAACRESSWRCYAGDGTDR